MISDLGLMGAMNPMLLPGAADFDLVAVGARTHSRLYRVLLGSVAAKPLRGSHRSVLAIPAKAEHAAGTRAVSVADARPLATADHAT